jgi:hypothetical protein
MSDDSGCPFARAMRETLDAVVTPAVREALIHDALILAGLGTLPQRGDAMRAFAGEQLRAVVARTLGAELAASITEEILRTIGPSTPVPSTQRGHTQRASRAPSHRRVHSPPPPTRRTPVVVTSGVESSRGVLLPAPRSATPAVAGNRRRTVPAESAWPTGIGSHIRTNAPEQGLSRALRDTDPAGDPRGSRAPVSGVTPFLFVATLDASLLGSIATRCEGRARVSSVRTPAELVKRLEALDGGRCIVVLDGLNPSIRPAALAVLLEDAPSVVDVVFCRAEPQAEAHALAVSASVSRWIVYRDTSPLDKVAAECIRLVS